MKTIIIDYNSGNLRSAANILEHLGVSYEITSERDKILKADRLIFPGQGHFGQAMESLKKAGLDDAVKAAVSSGAPFLGICAGMQILFEESEEAPGVKGLGIFKGKVKRYKAEKVPQIGWTKIKLEAANKYLPESYFYFVNSYHCMPEDALIISASGVYYGERFCAAVQKDNVTAVQFHPEKSAKAGEIFFKNWINS